jgi:chromosome partitioning protein
MIVSVTSLKGGVGKSTIAQNLAVCFAHSGYKTCIADADTNQSSVRWSGLRDEGLPGILVNGLPDGRELAKNVKVLNDTFDIIVIDGTPSLSATTSKILLLADILLIPVLPSALDLWATQQFIERYRDAKEQREQNIPAYFVLNQHDERTTLGKEIRDALDAFKEDGIGVLETSIKNRASYKKAVMEGLGVYEYTDAKAKEEIVALANEIQTLISAN